jgi:hypothetical protein
VIEHLEQHLGPIAGGWTSDASGARLIVPISRFPNQPVGGALTIATIGLSHHLLQQPRGPIRQELIFAFWSRFEGRASPGMLDHLARQAVSSHQAYLRGQWITFSAPAVEGTEMTALYVGPNIGFPDDMSLVSGVYPEAVVMVRVLPITGREAELCATSGWPALEEKLESARADLLDLERGSVV